MHSPAHDALFISLWIAGAVLLVWLFHTGLLRVLARLHRRALIRRGDFRHLL